MVGHWWWFASRKLCDAVGDSMLDTVLVIDLGREALWVAGSIAGPLLGIALIASTDNRIIQAATSLNEMTLSLYQKLPLWLAVLVLFSVLGIGNR